MENITVIKGKNGSGKTTLLLGQATFSRRNNKKVLIINNEESPEVLKRMLKTLNDENEMQGISLLSYFESETRSLNEIIEDFDVILIDNLELVLGYKGLYTTMDMIKNIAHSNKNKEFFVTFSVKTMI